MAATRKLDYFIKYQRTTILSQKRENKKLFGKAMQAIFESNGTEIANCKRYKIDSDKQTYDNEGEYDTLDISIDEYEENQVEMQVNVEKNNKLIKKQLYF